MDRDIRQLIARCAVEYPLLKADEEVELGGRIERGDRAAREALALANVRLVAKGIASYRWSGLDDADLFSAGMAGLMVAVDKFDPARGNKFSTMATWWIRNALGRAVAVESRAVRLPQDKFEALQRMRRMDDRPNDLNALAALVGTSTRAADALRRQLQPVVSLAFPLFGTDGDGATLGGTLADRSPGPDSAGDAAAAVEGVYGALASLSRLEQVVLSGMHLAEPPLTHLELARQLQRRTAEARAIEAKALRKLRHPSRADALREFA